MTFDDWRETYSKYGMMNEAMARAAWNAAVKQEQKQFIGLSDSEWVNIVNKNHAWFRWEPDAVAEEVAKLVEQKLKEKNS